MPENAASHRVLVKAGMRRGELRSNSDANVCIDAYARLRARQRARGTAMGANDLTIASIALTHGLALVSDDRAAFARVPGLTVVSWRDG